MTFGDLLHYVAIGNPVSKAVIGTTSSVVYRVINVGGASGGKMLPQSVQKTAIVALQPLWKLAGMNYNFVRLAGLSGASAVILGAIGSHKLNVSQDKADLKLIFETANRFHFFHSLALFACPLARYPLVTGILMAAGTTLFCGTLYVRAFTGQKQMSHLAPMGGTILIFAWLSLMI